MSEKDLKEQILDLQEDVKKLKEEIKDRNTRIIALESENEKLDSILEMYEMMIKKICEE